MYHLVYPVLGSFPSIKIEPEFVFSIMNSTDKLKVFLSIEEEYDFIVGNYLDLEKEILSIILKDSIKKPTGIYVIYENSRLISRKVLNFLTSTKMYLDQLSTKLHKIKGKASLSLIELVKVDRKNNETFILMNNLRNYMQHCGIPIFAVANMKKLGKQDQMYIFHYCSLAISTAEFLKDPIMRKLYANKYSKHESIDILRLIHVYFEEISLLHEKIRGALKVSLAEYKETIDNAFKIYASEYPKVLDGWQKILGIIKKDTNGLFFEFSRNSLDLIEKLQSENCSFTNMRARFVSDIDSDSLAQLSSVLN